MCMLLAVHVIVVCLADVPLCLFTYNLAVEYVGEKKEVNITIYSIHAHTCMYMYHVYMHYRSGSKSYIHV